MTGSELRAARKALGMTISGFALWVGAGERTVRRWQAGTQDIPVNVVSMVRGELSRNRLTVQPRGGKIRIFDLG